MPDQPSLAQVLKSGRGVQPILPQREAAQRMRSMLPSDDDKVRNRQTLGQVLLEMTGVPSVQRFLQSGYVPGRQSASDASSVVSGVEAGLAAQTGGFSAGRALMPGNAIGSAGGRLALPMTAEEALKSGEYLVRGARDGGLRLGNEGGVWATDNLDLARTFGDRIEVVGRPKKVFEADAFSIGDRAGIDPEDMVHASELTDAEWKAIADSLRAEGYDAVNFGEGHMDGAQDFWFLDELIDRFDPQ